MGTVRHCLGSDAALSFPENPSVADVCAAASRRPRIGVASMASKRIYTSWSSAKPASSADGELSGHEQEALVKRWLEMENARSRATIQIPFAASALFLVKAAPPALPQESDANEGGEDVIAPGWRELLESAEAAAKAQPESTGERILTDTHGCAASDFKQFACAALQLVCFRGHNSLEPLSFKILCLS